MTKNYTNIEVRYQETDQMAIVYHANYLVWFEIGRTKLIEQLGFSYTKMEEDGLLSPVIDVQASYIKPAKYGDEITIETWLNAYDGIRITYEYNIYNHKKELLVNGITRHVVVKKENFQPVRLRSVDKTWHQAYKNAVKGV